MSRHSVRVSTFTLLALFPILFTAAPLRAEPPDAPAPRHSRGAPRDTTQFLPTWLRPTLEFGGGWMSSPAELKRNYESGQGFGVGLEARPHSRWAVRTVLDYQMLIANSHVTILTIAPGGGVIDTSVASVQTTGWTAVERTELGARIAGDVWLTAGGGGGYMHSGLSGVETDLNSGLSVEPDGAVSNGWGWLWTAALRYDFTPAPRVPLGVDVRTSSLQRGSDAVRTWSVRLCFRVPEALPRRSRR